MSAVPPKAPKRSLFSLIGDLPHLLVDQVRNEIELLKKELTDKIKHAGIGIGLLVGAGAFAFFFALVLTAAGILGLATVLPAWAAALIVAGVLLLITVILALVGIAQLRSSTPATPEKTITSIKQDVRTIQGTGKRDTP
jgi:predicted phage tail protein